MVMRFFNRGAASKSQESATNEVTADHGLSTVREDESEDLAKSKVQGSPAYVTNTALAEEPPNDGFKLPIPTIPKDWRNISTPSNSFGSDYDAREPREDGPSASFANAAASFQTQGVASWSTQYEFPSYQGPVPPPFPLPLPGDQGIPGLGDHMAGKDFPSWMTEDRWPSYSEKPEGCNPMMMAPFPLVPPVGADSQSLAQYSASLQAIADQYSRMATVAATQERDLGLPLPCGSVNPWSLPDVGAGYAQRNRTRTDSVQSQTDVAPVVKSESEWVTVMIRNLPNNYGRNDVVTLLDEQGFKAKYDFVYLPIDFKNSSGLGYAFVNMVSHEDALEVMNKLGGFKDWKVPSQKVCEVAWGNPEQQGLDFHIGRYRNSPVMHNSVKEEFKPLIFQNGTPIPFPEPTKAPRRPRMKKHARIGCRSPEASDKEEDGEHAEQGTL